MSAVAYAVMTVHVHVCGSSAPRTRPAPDSQMYTTAHVWGGGGLLEGLEGGGVGLAEDQGARSLWDFVRTFTTCPSPEKMQG